MTSFDTTLLSPSALPLSHARTTVLTVTTPFEAVFNHLANVENLPRWAPDFCESLRLGREHWTAFTGLGELFIVIETNANTGKIVFCVGWSVAEFRRLPLQISPCAEGTRLKFLLSETADEAHARIFGALESALSKWVVHSAGVLCR